MSRHSALFAPGMGPTVGVWGKPFHTTGYDGNSSQRSLALSVETTFLPAVLPTLGAVDDFFMGWVIKKPLCSPRVQQFNSHTPFAPPVQDRSKIRTGLSVGVENWKLVYWEKAHVGV